MANPIFDTAFVLVEAALIAAALAAVFTPRLITPVRWLARGMVLVSLVIAIAAGLSAAWEISTYRYPLTLPDAPLGTYARPTTLGVLTVVIAALIVVAGGALSFRRPGPAGLLFVIAGVFSTVTTNKEDPSAPPGTFKFALIWVALPALTVGALLLSTWWTGRERAARPARRVR